MSASSGTLFEDRLTTLGLVVGVSLVLVGLATALGTPWTQGNFLAGLVQVVGAVLAVLIGAGLAWLARA
jgi:hypothetical protein